MRVSLNTPIRILALVAVLAMLLGLSSLAAAQEKKIEIIVGDGAWLGVRMTNLSEKLAEAMDLDDDDGVLIEEVVEDSPAEEAGLEDGDVVIAMDGEDIDDSADLVRFVGDSEPGDEVEVQVVRDGKVRTYKVTLGERENKGRRVLSWTSEGDHDFGDDENVFFFHGEGDENVQIFANKMAFFGNDRGFLGVSLGSLSTQLGEYFGVEDGEGALINEIVEDSPAEAAGLEAGDVIIAIEDEDIESPSDITEALGDTESGDEVEVTIVRDRKERTFEVTLGEQPEMDFEFHGDFPQAMHGLHGIKEMRTLPHDIKIRRMLKGDAPHIEVFEHDDLDDLREQMDDLRKELKAMKKELKK